MHTERSSLRAQLTQLHRPGGGEGLVERARLDALLEGGRRFALILVSAPAGYGKTTLVSGWLAAREPAAVWVRLDETDNEPAVFLDDLVAALRSRFPDGFARATSVFPASPQDEQVLAADALLADAGALEQEIVLVLDDYQLIMQPPVHDLMAHMVEHLPANLHLLLATHADPPLPLARSAGAWDCAGDSGGRSAVHGRGGARLTGGPAGHARGRGDGAGPA